MRAAELIEEYKKNKATIEELQEQVTRIIEQAQSTTAPIDSDNIRGSKVSDKVGNAVVLAVDIQQCRLKELADRNMKLLSIIGKLPSKHYDVIIRVCINDMPLMEYADSNNRGYSWASHMKLKAIESLDIILNNCK